MITRTKAASLLTQLWCNPGSGNTQTQYYYLGLSTTTPNPDGTNFTEPVIPNGATDASGDPITVNEYKRVSLEGHIQVPTTTNNNTTVVLNGIIENKDAIMFPEAENYSWGTITHFGIFTASSGGTPIFYGELSSSVTIPQNYIPVFRKSKLKIGLDRTPSNPEIP